MIHRLPCRRVPAPRVIEIAQVEPAANDPTCWPMERRAVAWTFVFCLVLAVAIVLPRLPA